MIKKIIKNHIFTRCLCEKICSITIDSDSINRFYNVPLINGGARRMSSFFFPKKFFLAAKAATNFYTHDCL